jgi:hypothetical protein
MKAKRNRNPNCNHNNSSVFYQPTFNSVKYNDQYKRKEEALRRVLFSQAPEMNGNGGINGPPGMQSNTVPNTNPDFYLK